MVARILVVDDHPQSLTLMLYLLKARGYQTVFATDGAEAVNLAREERPDLIICELRLPTVNGLRVAEQIRRSDGLRDLPLLAVSDVMLSEVGGKMTVPGFAAYYAKPIDPDTFVEAVERHLPAKLRAPHRPAIRPRGQRRKTDPL